MDTSNSASLGNDPFANIASERKSKVPKGTGDVNSVLSEYKSSVAASGKKIHLLLIVI